jgi:hypothetical protein
LLTTVFVPLLKGLGLRELVHEIFVVVPNARERRRRERDKRLEDQREHDLAVIKSLDLDPADEHDVILDLLAEGSTKKAARRARRRRRSSRNQGSVRVPEISSGD